MSSRIHEIAKQYNVEPKDMLSWLKEQGYIAADTKSVSSTVSKIYYDEIEKKYGKPAVVVVEAPVAPVPVVPEASHVRLPAGVFVKSLLDVTREKEEAAKAVAAARAAALPPAPVAAPKPPAPMMKAPPMPPPAGLRPVSTAPMTPRPAPFAAAPRSAAPRSAPSAPPMNKAPIAPPPVPSARPSAPPVFKPAPPLSATAAPSATAITVTEEGGVKIIHLKPPIIVREFAVALGLKPFKLISELMEMSIFASMNQSIDEAVASKLAEKHGFLLEIGRASCRERV